METVYAQCDSCGGKGLYSGMCEGPNRAVICLDCEGTGCREIRYKPYEGRVRTNKFNVIQFSRGRFIAGPIGGGGDTMTYREFEEKVPAVTVRRS